LVTLLVFVDVGEGSIMTDDVVTLSNLQVALVEKEELGETQLDVNVSQGRAKKNRPEKWCALESII